MRDTTMDEIERPYDGCGKCLLGVRRLSRVKAATTSPERQREDVLTAAAAVGGHIIDWADDWEVSGATDPMTRPRLGPWLRDERGPYDGLVASAVDRLGRNVVDCLNTGYKMRDEGKLLVTHGHEGVWNLDDPNDENRFTMEAWGAQMELRAIQRRNRDATRKIRAAGRPKGKPSYGFQYVRTVPNGRVERVELHPHAAEVLRNVAQRILADPDNVSPSSEAARLNRLGEPSPTDHLAVMYGKQAGGRPWYPTSLRNMLLSEAALGYLVHQRKPVIDRTGNPVRLCEGLWNRATHNALKEALRAGDTPYRGRRSNRSYLLTEVALCGDGIAGTGTRAGFAAWANQLKSSPSPTRPHSTSPRSPSGPPLDRRSTLPAKMAAWTILWSSSSHASWTTTTPMPTWPAPWAARLFSTAISPCSTCSSNWRTTTKPWTPPTPARPGWHTRCESLASHMPNTPPISRNGAHSPSRRQALAVLGSRRLLARAPCLAVTDVVEYLDLGGEHVEV
jgi:DNA invertase Pin-like site-specific DNA recombinase